jgi:hypothetical protein
MKASARSWPRRPSYFWRPKSNQKRSQQKCFLSHLAFALQIRQNRSRNLFAGLPFPSDTFMQKFAMPFHSQATIVLPDFIRSLSAEKNNNEKNQIK